MAARTVEVSLGSLANVPLEVVVLAAVYTVGPLLVALAVFHAARRVAAALHLVADYRRVEPTMPMDLPRSKQDAAYEAVRDWYAEEGGPAAHACYMLLSSHTGRCN